MICVGIDLSLTSTGLCALDVVPSGVADCEVRRIQSKGSKDASLADRQARLHTLTDRITDWLFTTEFPQLVVIEAPAFSRQTGHMHDRSGLWWMVVHRLHGEGVPVAEVAPSARAKYATGKGNAGKDQVLAAVIRRYPHADVTGNDVADALVLAAMGAHHHGMPPAEVPKIHADALLKVRWPDTTTDPDLMGDTRA